MTVKLHLSFLFLNVARALACPVYLKCNTGGAGLGDQLEHYVYCLFCAKLLNASLLLEGFVRGPTFHHGSDQYRDAAQLLGIEFLGGNSTGLPEVYLTMSNVLSLHEGTRNGSIASSCSIVYRSDISSCPDVGSWCDFLPFYNSLSSVIWKLRRKHATQKCFERGLGLRKSSTKVNIVWHARVGDVCLHCDAGYYTELYTLLLRASPAISSSHQLIFESQGELPFLHRLNLFENATFNSNSTILETICNFMTSDVLLTSGSSLSPFVAAFSLPWSPIVLEERRKEATRESKMAHHFFNSEQAILLEDGRPLKSEEEFSAILESILGQRDLLHRRNFTTTTVGILARTK